MLGFQAAGAAPIVLGRPIENPDTVATAIRIGNPASWAKAEAARDESDGLIRAVEDSEILQAQKEAAHEGVFVEPASAASLAGLVRLAGEGWFDGMRGEILAVATLTGHGLKDPDTAIRQSEKPVSVTPDLGEILTRIEDLRGGDGS